MMGDADDPQYTQRVEIPVGETVVAASGYPRASTLPTEANPAWYPGPDGSAVPPPSAEAVMYVPLAITVGDGFKFGCGFFMAGVLAMLIGFVLLSALFAASSLMGINLPLAR